MTLCNYRHSAPARKYPPDSFCVVRVKIDLRPGTAHNVSLCSMRGGVCRLGTHRPCAFQETGAVPGCGTLLSGEAARFGRGISAGILRLPLTSRLGMMPVI
jgi:hypothetical protein